MADRCAVLTGDIVKSTEMSSSQVQAIMASLAEQAEIIRRWDGVKVPELERSRGDGWQFVLPAPRWALRASLTMRAAVKQVDRAADTRISVGIGQAYLASTLSSSEGPAFERSGRELERLKARRRMGFYADIPEPELRLCSALFGVCDALSASWTSRQAEIFTLLAAPDPPTVPHVSETLEVTPQAIQAHFAKSGGAPLIHAAEAFEWIF
ncbi:hypothetical protein FKB34_13660 [Glycocaulis profundi]|nr:hypothetical protein FKB34_13660 [Glycocaulis profundi]